MRYAANIKRPLPSETFRTRVREARTQRGLSQRALVDALRERGIEIHQPAYSDLENGRRSIGLDEAVAIARVLKVPVERLYMTWEDLLVFEAEIGLAPAQPKEQAA
jgi:transcriptional regulator with XRE-family HTH domain